MTSGSLWQLCRFGDAIDQWIPHPELRPVVEEWLRRLAQNPAAAGGRLVTDRHLGQTLLGDEEEPGFENMWDAQIPGTAGADGTAVFCTYLVDVDARTVTCVLFGPRPIL